MNTKQIAKMMDYAKAAMDSAYFLFPRSQRTAAARDLVDKITAARRVIAARAAADNNSDVLHLVSVLGKAADADPAADAEAAIKTIEAASAALAAMPQAE